MYLLFAGLVYYAKGGVHDLQGVYTTVEEATAQGQKLIQDEDIDFHWYHIYGITERAIVAKSKAQAHGVWE